MSQSASLLLIICLVAFGVYRRVRRSIGWQRFNPRGMQVRLWIFAVIGLVFFVLGAMHPVSLVSDIVGILIGIVLAYYGASMTVVEQRNGQLQYRPNTWIGSIVIALFFIRLIYRLYGTFTTVDSGGMTQAGQNADSLQSISGNGSWSSGFLLIMFAYYIVYYIILLRKQKLQLQSGRI